MKLTENNVCNFIGKEVFCTATDEKVLLKRYSGNGLAYISRPEKFVRGKYPSMSIGCLLVNLEILN